MDQLLKEAKKFKDLTTMFTIWDVFIAIGLSFILGLIITWTYRKTHQGISYSQSFVQTIIIMGVVVSVIMLIIGSNIARAFSLVGALSIVRFRSAIKDPKDVAFIFFAMAAGMACGTRFYLLGVIFAVTLCVLIYALYIFNYGEKKGIEKILKIVIPENLNYEGLFEEIFEKYLGRYSLVSVQTTKMGTMMELIYLIRMKKGTSDKTLIDSVRAVNGNLKVSIVVGQQNVDL